MRDRDDYGFDLDDILAEFSAYSEQLAKDETEGRQTAPSEPETNIYEPQTETEVDMPAAQDNTYAAAEPEAESMDKSDTAQNYSELVDAQEEAEPAAETEPDDVRAENPVQVVQLEDVDEPINEPLKARAAEKPAQKKPVPGKPAKAKKAAERTVTQPHEMPEKTQETENWEEPERLAPLALRVLLDVLSLALLALALVWTGTNIHPGTERAKTETGTTAKADLVSKLDVYLNNAASDALGELAYIRKQYTLDYYSTVAPKPDASKYGAVSISEADKVMDVVNMAMNYGLLDGQELIFDPATEFYWDSDIEYYCDETILVICWKERIENRVCSCVEVKIADGSQIRRKIMNDTFGSPEWGYASELAMSANAVVAMNADFYMYRDLGTCIYQGQIGRFDTSCDLLMIDTNGDFNMLRASELTDRASLEQYITDKNILFGMAFGPILVKDGELQQLNGSYAGGIGEMYEQYSRAGIGQVDKLHYLYMTVNHSQDSTPRADVNTFAKIMYSKGVKNAYNFDGGQTSEIMFNGDMYNYVDWGYERAVSDIIYFATAIPSEEVG